MSGMIHCVISNGSFSFKIYIIMNSKIYGKNLILSFIVYLKTTFQSGLMNHEYIR